MSRAVDRSLVETEPSPTVSLVEAGRQAAEHLMRARYPADIARYKQNMVTLGMCLMASVDQPDHPSRGVDNKDRQRAIHDLFGPVSREMCRNARFAAKHATQYFLYSGYSPDKFRKNWGWRMARLLTNVPAPDPRKPWEAIETEHPWRRHESYLRRLGAFNVTGLFKELTPAQIEAKNRVARKSKAKRASTIPNRSAPKDKPISRFGLRTGSDRAEAPVSFDTAYDVEEARKRLDLDRKILKRDDESV